MTYAPPTLSALAAKGRELHTTEKTNNQHDNHVNKEAILMTEIF